MKKTIREEVKAIRVLTGKSQVEFGKLIGVSRNVVYNYERGLTEPKASTYNKIRSMVEKNAER